MARRATICLLALLAWTLSGVAWAQICARVKIEIQQRVTFERIAFDARLVVTNNLTETWRTSTSPS